MPENNELLYREITFQREWLDEEKRESTISFSSEIEVSRWGIIEILDHSPGAVDLGRLQTIGAHLFNHNPDRIIGPVKDAKIESGRGIATVGYDDTDEGETAFKRTKSGSLKGISVGYRVQEWKNLREGETYQLATKAVKCEPGQEIYIGKKWTPIEITSTPIPADASVGHGRDIFMRSIGAAKREEAVMPVELTAEQIQKLVSDGIRAALPEVVNQVRATMAEEARPQIRVSTEIFTDLTNRAGAISLEAKSKITDMILSGKTEQEATRALLDLATGKPDAKDTGGESGDPTKRTAAATHQVDKLDDDVFARAFGQTAVFKIQ